MNISSEWDNLMAAPWGSTDEVSVTAKAQALADYDIRTTAFWAKRNLPVPTLDPIS